MVRPRAVAPLALLAMLPVLAYFLDRGDLFVAAAFVNVVLIAASLWLLFGGEDGDATSHTSAR